MPTLATFDHVIVAPHADFGQPPACPIEQFPAFDPKSQILWIDPTSEVDPLGQVPEMDQGVYVLISYPDHGDLQRIPESPIPRRMGLRTRRMFACRPMVPGIADVEVGYPGMLPALECTVFIVGLSHSDILNQDSRTGSQTTSARPSFDRHPSPALMTAGNRSRRSFRLREISPPLPVATAGFWRRCTSQWAGRT